MIPNDFNDLMTLNVPYELPHPMYVQAAMLRANTCIRYLYQGA